MMSRERSERNGRTIYALAPLAAKRSGTRLYGRRVSSDYAWSVSLDYSTLAPPEAAVPPPPRLWPVALVAAAFAALLYAITLGGTYVFDDYYLVYFDDRVARPAQWLRYLTESYNDGVDNLYRPLTSFSLAVQVWLHGASDAAAWAFHGVNVAMYAMICAQIAVLAGRLLAEDDARRPAAAGRAAEPRRTKWVALGAGLLFAALPVHVEAVAGVAGRAELVAAAGFLGGLLVLTRPLTPWRVAGFVACLFVSIGGKEQGLLLPGVAATWYAARWWASRPPRTGGRGRALVASVALPLAAYLIWREHILPMAWPRSLLDPTIQPMILADASDRALMPFAILGRYAALVVWPRTLALDYGAAVIVPPQVMGDPYLWIGVVTAVASVIAAVHAIRRRWVAGLVCLGGLGLSYGVVSNSLSLIGTVFGERLVFLPSAFVIVYVVLLADRLFAARRIRLALLGVAAAVVVAGGARTFVYAAQWNDRLALYANQVAAQPRSVRLWLLYGDLLNDRGRIDEAAAAGRRATDLAPDYWGGWLLRSDAALAAGDLEAALSFAETAVDIKHLGRTVGKRDQIQALMADRRAQTRPAATTQP